MAANPESEKSVKTFREAFWLRVVQTGPESDREPPDQHNYTHDAGDNATLALTQPADERSGLTTEVLVVKGDYLLWKGGSIGSYSIDIGHHMTHSVSRRRSCNADDAHLHLIFRVNRMLTRAQTRKGNFHDCQTFPKHLRGLSDRRFCARKLLAFQYPPCSSADLT